VLVLWFGKRVLLMAECAEYNNFSLNSGQMVYKHFLANAGSVELSLPGDIVACKFWKRLSSLKVYLLVQSGI